MPNWCDNRLEISGPIDAINAFIDGASDEDGSMSILDSYLPFPPGFHGETVGKFRVFSDRGLNWCLKNWGVKWADSDTFVIGRYDDEDTSNVTLFCTTPWGPPEVGMQNVSKLFPQLTFAIAYHEDGAGIAGGSLCKNGEVLSQVDMRHSLPQYEDGSDEQKEEVWYDRLEEMYVRIFQSLFDDANANA